jgi:hypothetical protein
MIHDVVGGAAHEELDRPGPRRPASGVVGADGIEIRLPVRREAIRGEDGLERRPDFDLARGGRAVAPTLRRSFPRRIT